MKQKTLVTFLIGVLIGAGVYYFFGYKTQELVATEEPITIRWHISHYPERYFLRAAETFKEIVEAESNGEITVLITTADDSEKTDFRANGLELIENGQADMMQVYTDVFANDGAVTKVLGLPHLFNDYDHIDSVVDGPIGENILSDIDSKISDVVPLAFTFSGGYLSFASPTHDLQNLEDLAGLKVALFNDTGISGQLKSTLGFNIPADYAGDRQDIWDALEREAVDVVEFTYIDILDLFGQGDLQSVLHSRHSVLFTALVINQTLYDTLSAEHQAIVKAAAREAARAERKEIAKDDERVQTQVSLGIQLHELSASDRELLNEVADSVYAQLSQEEKLLVDEIRALQAE